MAHRIIWLPDEVFEELKQYIISGSYAKENSIQLDKFIFMPERLNDMTDKPKAKMTRAEAIRMFLKHIPEADYKHADSLVDFYIEAGMLEVVEESPLEGLPMGFKFPYSQREEWAECCKALYDQGYMILKLDTPT